MARSHFQTFLILLTCLSFFSFVSAVIAPFIEQSFFFDYNDGQPIPVPVTKQCDTIHLKWDRGSATGPNPVSPYHLEVYTSASNVPFSIPAGNGLTFDWQVPFAPGTLYQICMYDKNGNAGGCQATYTVIPADSGNAPNCANITFNPILDVDAEVINGPMSQYGWIDQCTDISLSPKNGTPPYTMTIAPQLHPPYKITGNDMKAINWTVSLSWGSGFFVSLEDSAGGVWSNGLLHSGGGGSTDCFIGAGNNHKSTTIKPIIAIGTGVGGIVIGLLLGGLFAFMLLRCQRRHQREKLVEYHSGTFQGTVYNPGTLSEYLAVPSTIGVMDTLLNINNRNDPIYAVEPFLTPDEHGHRTSISGSSEGTAVGSSQRKKKGGAVYVMHHDSGRAPVTVFHDDGAQVVELPPRYADGGGGPGPSSQPDLLGDNGTSAGHEDMETRSNSGLLDTSEGPAFLQQPRRPDAPRKPGRSGNASTLNSLSTSPGQ